MNEPKPSHCTRKNNHEFPVSLARQFGIQSRGWGSLYTRVARGDALHSLGEGLGAAAVVSTNVKQCILISSKQMNTESHTEASIMGVFLSSLRWAAPKPETTAIASVAPAAAATKYQLCDGQWWWHWEGEWWVWLQAGLLHACEPNSLFRQCSDNVSHGLVGAQPASYDERSMMTTPRWSCWTERGFLCCPAARTSKQGGLAAGRPRSGSGWQKAGPLWCLYGFYLSLVHHCR